MCAVLCASAHPEPVLTETARQFLAALTPEQRAKTVFSLEDEERFRWFYVPIERKGLPLREMTATQKHLAHALLASALSQRGYIKTTTIMSLEEILRILEKDSGERRHPEKYYVSIFGEPSEAGVWAFRFEGHHVSLNFTLARGQIVASPNFLGSNPAEVRGGPRKGLRALRNEEDLARALLDALTPEQKAVAIVDPKAPADILTTNSRRAAIEGQPSGLAADKMTAEQQKLLHALIAEYVNNVPEPVARGRAEQVRAAGGRIYFAWAGAEQRGGPHYYRVQAPAFLIEYDNTQDGANHIHSVWRDFDNDWGLDLLKRHYETSHRPGAEHP